MADIGYITLFLALAVSAYSAIAFIYGVKRKHLALTRSARNGLLAVCGLVSISVAILAYALVNSHSFETAHHGRSNASLNAAG